MKCNHCGSEWSVSPGLSMSITNCPFCGNSLLPEKKQLNTVEDVLAEINRLFGVSVLADETKLVAYFSDLAPQLSRQRRILGYFVECGGPKKIVAALNSSDDEQSVCIKQIVREMKNEMYIEEAASQMICESFLFAVSGRRANEISTVSAPKVPQTLVNMVTTSQGGEDDMTAEEQYQEGEAYYNGIKAGNPVPKDYKKAFEWYQKAADRGHPLAQCQLGLMYSDGHGIPKDEKSAFNWFVKAAHVNQNCPRGKFLVGYSYDFGVGVQKDYKEAVRWYTMAAKENYASAQRNLGASYESGEGVDVDYSKAAYWYELSAKQGDSLAQRNLGCLYAEGKGVSKDASRAVCWYQKAADNGDTVAMVRLGDCYASGEGVTQNRDQAIAWYGKATKEGEQLGLKALQIMFLILLRVRGMNESECKKVKEIVDTLDDKLQLTLADGSYSIGREMVKYPSTESTGLKIIELCAQEGDAHAQLWLGQAFDTGTYLPINKRLASYWYQKAADQGNDAAKTHLNKLHRKELTEVQINALVAKHHLQSIYFTKDTVEFNKKIKKAVSAYAASALHENPLLLEDATVFGSAKEGFVLTPKTLFYNGGFLAGKGKYAIRRIESASACGASVRHIELKIAPESSGDPISIAISFTTEYDEAARIEAFWKDLLQMIQ